jgi:putative ABC transport system permease protein
MRARASLRRGWVSTLVVASIVALVSGAVLAIVAGARRTGSAPDRYTASVGGDFSANLEQRSGTPLTKQIAALPEVKDLSAQTFLFAGFDDQTRKIPEDLILFAGTRPLASPVIEGHDLDSARPHEFIADKRTAAALHARIGDRFRFMSYSRGQQGFQGEPKGPSFDDAQLVGIIDSPNQFQSDYEVGIFPTSLLDQDIGFVATVSQARLAQGVGLDDLRNKLDTLRGGKSISIVDAGRVVSSDVRSAVDAQSQGIWIMGAVLALATLIALGQLLSRHVRLAEHERVPLGAVGFTQRQLTLECMVRAAVPAVFGVITGAALAIAASGRFPTGYARAIEPHRGIAPDAVALGIGGAFLVFALMLWVGISFAAGNRARSRRVARSSGASLVERVPSTTAAIGTRFALTRTDGSTVSALGTIGVLAIIIAALIGTTAFAVSLDDLVTNRARFGQNYDFTLGSGGVKYRPAYLRKKLVDEPDVAGLMILSEGSARAKRLTSTTADAPFTVIDLVGVERVKGDLAPRVLAGALPTTPNEVAFGRQTATQLGATINRSIHLEGPKGRGGGEYKVVGIVVVPGIAGNDGVGKGAVMTGEGMRTLETASETNGAAIQLRAGATPAAAKAIATRFDPKTYRVWSGQGPTEPGQESLPGVIGNIARVKRIPVALASLLAALGLVTMLHALVVSIQQRRHDIAVLRAIGADRRWVSRTVHWQATVLSAIPLVVGVPLGIFAGSVVFRSFVNHIGAFPTPVVPILLVLGIALAILVTANIAAIVPAVRARRLSTAELLRDE